MEIKEEEGLSSKVRDLIGCLVALLAALNGGLAIIWVRKLSDQVHCAIQPLYYMIAMTTFCPIWSLMLPVTKASDLTLYSWELYAAAFGLASLSFV